MTIPSNNLPINVPLLISVFFSFDLCIPMTQLFSFKIIAEPEEPLSVAASCSKETESLSIRTNIQVGNRKGTSWRLFRQDSSDYTSHHR